ncbi:MAG: hypothetical protein IKP42_02810, partial [Ruminococcus sp.]|nr:hypothetical protein [Ruminococcus sp.]
MLYSGVRADNNPKTEGPLRERYEIGIRYTKLSQLAYQTQPSKDGEEVSKIGKGKEEEGEEKESAERKNVGRRREGNADFCASFVVPSLLFPKFVLFALHVNGGKSVELWIELQVCRFISHFSKTVTSSAESEGETSVRGKEKTGTKVGTLPLPTFPPRAPPSSPTPS